MQMLPLIISTIDPNEAHVEVRRIEVFILSIPRRYLIYYVARHVRSHRFQSLHNARGRCRCTFSRFPQARRCGSLGLYFLFPPTPPFVLLSHSPRPKTSPRCWQGVTTVLSIVFAASLSIHPRSSPRIRAWATLPGRRASPSSAILLCPCTHINYVAAHLSYGASTQTTPTAPAEKRFGESSNPHCNFAR